MSRVRPDKGLLDSTFRCVLTLTWISTIIPTVSWSFDPVLPTATIPDLSSYIAQSNVDTFVKTVGFCMDHRPYEPATSLGTSFDFGIETTLVMPPGNLGSSISSIESSYTGSPASSTSEASPIPFIPSVKMHLRRGLGDKFDVGLSTLLIPESIPYAGGTLLLGGDLKYILINPEEGITWALRASYNYINLALQYTGYIFSIKTVTITPQLIISRKLAFFDPYLGFGVQYTYGSIRATIPSPPIDLLPGIAIAPISISVDGGGTGISFFGGLSLLSVMRLRLTLEGAYNPAGESYLGTKIGFTL
ncbi:MAG: hypothetical protein ABIQ95_09655 [Bdellovibrionia bacterium]